MNDLLEALIGKAGMVTLMSWIAVGVGVIAIWAGAEMSRNSARARVPGERPWLIFVVRALIGTAFILAGIFLIPRMMPSAQAQALDAIKRAGGELEEDLTAPEKPVVGVRFSHGGPPLTDSSLRDLKAHLQALPQIRHLVIGGFTEVTDAGLESLKGLTQLETVEIYCGGVTDTGVADLQKALPNAKILFFSPWPHVNWADVAERRKAPAIEAGGPP
jgi:hypothetical protein